MSKYVPPSPSPSQFTTCEGAPLSPGSEVIDLDKTFWKPVMSGLTLSTSSFNQDARNYRPGHRGFDNHLLGHSGIPRLHPSLYHLQQEHNATTRGVLHHHHTNATFPLPPRPSTTEHIHRPSTTPASHATPSSSYSVYPMTAITTAHAMGTQTTTPAAAAAAAAASAAGGGGGGSVESQVADTIHSLYESKAAEARSTLNQLLNLRHRHLSMQSYLLGLQQQLEQSKQLATAEVTSRHHALLNELEMYYETALQSIEEDEQQKVTPIVRRLSMVSSQISEIDRVTNLLTSKLNSDSKPNFIQMYRPLMQQVNPVLNLSLPDVKPPSTAEAFIESIPFNYRIVMDVKDIKDTVINTTRAVADIAVQNSDQHIDKSSTAEVPARKSTSKGIQTDPVESHRDTPSMHQMPHHVRKSIHDLSEEPERESRSTSRQLLNRFSESPPELEAVNETVETVSENEDNSSTNSSSPLPSEQSSTDLFSSGQHELIHELAQLKARRLQLELERRDYMKTDSTVGSSQSQINGVKNSNKNGGKGDRSNRSASREHEDVTSKTKTRKSNRSGIKSAKQLTATVDRKDELLKDLLDCYKELEVLYQWARHGPPPEKIMQHRLPPSDSAPPRTAS